MEIKIICMWMEPGAIIASRYALPGSYGDRQVWVRGLGWPDHCVRLYSSVCFEIKFSSRHKVFNGVLFNL